MISKKKERNEAPRRDYPMKPEGLTAPVNSQAKPYNANGIELTACQLHEALSMAGTMELAVLFPDRSRVRIFYNETGHSGPGLYCECVDAEDEGCLFLDGSASWLTEKWCRELVEGK